MKSELVIRPLHPDDAADLYAIVSHPAVARTMVRLPSMEFGETASWARKPSPGKHRLVAELGERVVGSANLTQTLKPRRLHGGRLGVMVHPDHWRQGIGSALTAAVLDLADNWLNLLRVELDVFTSNAAAVRLYEKFGFEIEGRRRMATFGDGRFQDEYLMARLAPNAPVAFPVKPPLFERRKDVASVEIRPLHSDDAADLYDCYRHPAVARTTNQVPSLELPAIIERASKSVPGLYRYVAVAHHRDGRHKVVGNVTLWQDQNPRLNHAGGLGMMVHPHYWGLGIGSQLVEAIIDLADNWLNLRRVELDVHTDNLFAIRLYEKFGFEREGTRRLFSYGDGRWADAHFMARLRQ